MTEYRANIVALACVVLIGSLNIHGQTSRPHGLTPTQVQKKALQSVLVIIASNKDDLASYCSGFFVRNGLVVTNYHCIRSAQTVVGKHIGQRKMFELSVVATDESSDLALMRVSDKASAFLALSPTNARVGETVFVLSNPEEYEGTFTRGMVNAYRRSGDMQIDAPISHGSSGGPVLNSRGEVIGVAHAFDSQGQNLNFAIPVSAVSSFVQQAVSKNRASEPVPDFSGIEKVLSDADQARLSFEEGEGLMQRHEFASALSAFRKAVQLDSQSQYYYGLSQAYSELNQDLPAIEACKKAIQMAGTDVPYYFYMSLGREYEKLSRSEDAITAYRAVVDTNPQSEVNYYTLARLYREQRNDAGALRIYQEAIKKLSKPSFLLYMELGSAYQKVGQPAWAMQAFEDAVKLTNSGIENSPMDASNYGDLAWAYDELSKPKEAADARMKEVELLRREISLKPETSWVYYRLASALRQLSNYSESIRAYKRAVELFHQEDETAPPKEMMLGELVSACDQSNDLGNKLWALKQLSNLKPKDASLHYTLGETYLKVGEKNNAKSEYRALLALDREKAAKLLKLIDQ